MFKVSDDDQNLILDIDLPSWGEQGVWLYNGLPFNGIILYRENGQVYGEDEYKNGMREGRQVEYWPNGNLKEEYYEKHGIYIGSYKLWNDQGVLISHQEFDEFGNWKETLVQL